MMKERSNQKAMAEENARQGQKQRAEKKPYQTPEITRLGNVKQLTTGDTGPLPDTYGVSF